jgi:hypothetical protein
MQRRKHLRHHQRRGRALRQPRDDQFRPRLREAAPERGQGEAEQAGQEHALRAVDVAEPAAGHDQRGIGDQVDRDDGFDLGRRGLQVDRNRGNGDVDHEGIDAEHELGGHDDCEDPPAAGRISLFCDDLMHWRTDLDS